MDGLARLKQAGLQPTFVALESRYRIAKMGTSGVREVREVYNQKHYLEQFIQGIADHFLTLPAEDLESGKWTILLGGDPRLGNAERIRMAARIFAASGFTVLTASHNGVSSTPAMSHAIRHTNAVAGIIFTASHNPFTDVGIKVNIHDGSPALEETAASIHEKQNSPNLTGFHIVDEAEAQAKGFIREIDTVQLYADLLDRIFRFEDMRRKAQERASSTGRPLQLMLDGMGGATGPFIREIFGRRLGMNADFFRCEPDPYLGGPNDPAHANHPEPDFNFIPDLIANNETGQYDIVAAYDSDGDRRLNGGGGFWIESADEFAIFAKYADLISLEQLFQKGEGGGEVVFARSAVTAPAIDLMHDFLRTHYEGKGYAVRILETATGFKWIAEYGNWGVEESNGLGNPWIREKDGIFATVFLLKILLETGRSPRELMEEVWQDFGRYYFARGEISRSPEKKPGDSDYEKERQDLEREKAALESLIDSLVENWPADAGNYGSLQLMGARRWDYMDPEGRIRARNAAHILEFSEGITVKMRFSGTGSGGYTLRIYITRFSEDFRIPKIQIMQPAKEALEELFHRRGFSTMPKNYNDLHQPEPYTSR